MKTKINIKKKSKMHLKKSPNKSKSDYILKNCIVLYEIIFSFKNNFKHL